MSKKELKKTFDEYIENSPGVDEYAMELFNAQDRRIKELEEQNQEMLKAFISNYKSIGSWMSAALEDPKVCQEMRDDIYKFFENYNAVKKITGKSIDEVIK